MTRQELTMILKWALEARESIMHQPGTARTNLTMIINQIKEHLAVSNSKP